MPDLQDFNPVITGRQFITLSSTIGDYSIPDTAVANPTVEFSDAYTTNTGWTQVGTTITVDDVSFPDICKFNATSNNSVDNRVHKSLSVTLPNDKWEYTGSIVVGSQSLPSAVIISLSAGSSAPINSTQDSISISFDDTGGTNGFVLSYKDGGGSFTSTSSRIEPGAGTFYITFERTSTTTTKLELFSDSDRSVSVGSITQTIPSTVTGLTHIQHCNNSVDGTASVSMTFDIDDTSISSSTTASNINDDSVSTVYTTAAQVAPSVIVGMNALTDIVALAVYPKSTMTETEFKIRIGNTLNMTDSNLVRTITVSQLTNDVWNFILFNRPIINNRYLEIVGSSGVSRVLSFGEIKLRTMTADMAGRAHSHFDISTTNDSLALDGGTT